MTVFTLEVGDPGATTEEDATGFLFRLLCLPPHQQECLGSNSVEEPHAVLGGLNACPHLLEEALPQIQL